MSVPTMHAPPTEVTEAAMEVADDAALMEGVGTDLADTLRRRQVAEARP